VRRAAGVTGERRSVRLRVARSGMGGPRSPRRSGHRFQTAPKPSTPNGTRALILAITGIVLFPLAGIALFGHLLSPLGFVLLGALAGCVVFVTLAKLEPSS
jgi:hypothetical protein